MKLRGQFIWLAAMVILVGSVWQRAFADNISFIQGNHHLDHEENILFLSEQTGTLISGFTNQSHMEVDFSSTTDVLFAHGGQASIWADDGLINNITITAPDHSFTGFVFNAFGPVYENDLLVTVLDVDGAQYTYQYGSQNGENFLTIVDNNRAGIASITIDSEAGFAELKQNRIAGMDPGTTPEPSSFLLLGSGLIAAVGSLCRKN